MSERRGLFHPHSPSLISISPISPLHSILTRSRLLERIRWDSEGSGYMRFLFSSFHISSFFHLFIIPFPGVILVGKWKEKGHSLVYHLFLCHTTSFLVHKLVNRDEGREEKRKKRQMKVKNMNEEDNKRNRKGRAVKAWERSGSSPTICCHLPRSTASRSLFSCPCLSLHLTLSLFIHFHSIANLLISGQA